MRIDKIGKLEMVTVVLAVLTIGLAITQLPAATEQPFHQQPDGELNVICYKTVDNGTAKIRCPDEIYSPNKVINLTFKDCADYEYVNDEPHPCR